MRAVLPPPNTQVLMNIMNSRTAWYSTGAHGAAPRISCACSLWSAYQYSWLFRSWQHQLAAPASAPTFQPSASTMQASAAGLFTSTLSFASVASLCRPLSRPSKPVDTPHMPTFDFRFLVRRRLQRAEIPMTRITMTTITGMLQKRSQRHPRRMTQSRHLPRNSRGARQGR